MTTDIKELVKRLREVFVEDRGHGHTTEWTRNLDGHEAANALERLKFMVENNKATAEKVMAERDRLKAVGQKLLAKFDHPTAVVTQWDVDELRKALGGDE